MLAGSSNKSDRNVTSGINKKFLLYLFMMLPSACLDCVRTCKTCVVPAGKGPLHSLMHLASGVLYHCWSIASKIDWSFFFGARSELQHTI